jgi:hypothetical protein
MTHYDAILNHIKADTPCSYNHVTSWAVSQGFGGSKMVFAIQSMIREGVISIHNEDGSMTVELN